LESEIGNLKCAALAALLERIAQFPDQHRRQLEHSRDHFLHFFTGDRLKIDLRFFASATNSGSFIVALNALRKICTRSFGVPGGTT